MGVPGKRTVSKGGYAAYIRSPEWRAVRDRYWRSKLPKDCYVCGAAKRKGFHLHHRTYKNLGNERLMDLVPVCPGCHDAVHDFQRATGMDLWKATRRARREFIGRRPRV